MEKDILEIIYQKYTKSVYLYLYSLCHNQGMAEDLMQETFLRAFCSMEIAGEGIQPWLFTVARNLYLDTWRKQRHQYETPDFQEYANEEMELLEQLIQKERNLRLYQAVGTLTQIEKEVVILYYFSGLSQEEISRILELTYGNTRVLLYRAKRKLRKMLRDMDGRQV